VSSRRQAPRKGQSTGEDRSRLSVFQDEFREDLRFWVEADRKVAVRVLKLVEALMRDPFRGIGKPEPLRHLAANLWSRRVTERSIASSTWCATTESTSCSVDITTEHAVRGRDTKDGGRAARARHNRQGAAPSGRDPHR
jgi:toxin YoeB